MNRSEYPNYFYDLSVVLTGYDLVTLYGTGNGDLYLKTLLEILGEEFVGDLLVAFQTQLEDSKTSKIPLSGLVDGHLLENPKWGPVCRNIIQMWYMGNWYPLDETWTSNYITSTANVEKVLSPNAYIEGLVWKAMGRHTKGAKQPGFGTWHFAPQ